jgi:hypothetical protein
MITLRDVMVMDSLHAGVTWNPIGLNASLSLSSGNLVCTYTGGSGANVPVIATKSQNSGAHYFEVVISDTTASPFIIVGLAPSLPVQFPGHDASNWGYYEQTGQKYNNSAAATYGASYANGDVIGVGYNATAGTIEFFKNKVSQGIAFSGISGALFPCASPYRSPQALTLRITAAAIGTVPTGYTAWG